MAINLAAEHAAAGMSVMVIDADSYGASIAAALGLLEESASFAQACRVADQEHSRRHNFRPSPRRWCFQVEHFRY
ncbi:hypothetical protein NHF46_15995 [Arthrobacter alpinus]|nr:hypothetical protein [Arthrobacter alpinus]